MSESGFGLNNADARNLKQVLDSRDDTEDISVDAIITSPPYADLKDYGGDKQIGQQKYERFIDDIRDVFRQCYDLATNEATVWIISDVFKRNNRMFRLPSDLADALEDLPNKTTCPECGGYLRKMPGSGRYECARCVNDTGDPIGYDAFKDSWRMQDEIIWNKKRTLPWANKQLRNVHEHIHVFSKSDDYKFDTDDIRVFDTEELSKWWVGYPERYNPGGKIPENIWEYEIPKQGQWGPKMSVHPSPFPLGLVERILRVATDEGDVVLDPFAGVGTVLAVAEQMGRNAIGFEVNEEYINVYEEFVRDKAKENLKEKTTRTDELRETKEKIWTLRIHKYGFKVYKKLAEANGADHPDEIGVNTIIVKANQNQIPPEVDEEPEVDYIFALNGNSKITEEEISSAAEDIKNGGSGGYYGVDPAFSAEMAGQILTRINSGNWKMNKDNDIYVYVGGHHNWWVDDILLEAWAKYYGMNNWRRMIKNGYPPLVSNLQIQVVDESRSGKPPEVEAIDQPSVMDY